MVTGHPDEVNRLAGLREQARAAGDYATADLLRTRIGELGFDVTDTPAGPVITPAAGGATPRSASEAATFARSDDVPSLLNGPPSFDVSIQWVIQGWPQDVARGIASFRRHAGALTAHHVVVDLVDTDPSTWPEEADVVRLPANAGWSAARNAGLRRAAGRIVVLVDGSVEATGDALSPLARALEDPSVGVTGPFGIVSEDLRDFRESAGPDVDAVEGYLIAFGRGLAVGGLRFDEAFRFYRSADIELSFQVKAMGLRATVTSVPVTRHEHRVWHATPEHDRDRLSKRNFYRFLDRWRGRTDLLVSPGEPGSAPSAGHPPTHGRR